MQETGRVPGGAAAGRTRRLHHTGSQPIILIPPHKRTTLPNLGVWSLISEQNCKLRSAVGLSWLAGNGT